MGRASSLGEFKTLYPKRTSWEEKKHSVHKRVIARWVLFGNKVRVSNNGVPHYYLLSVSEDSLGLVGDKII